MRIAVIGSGISGLMAAYLLSRRHEVVLFEADDRLGGHTHTIEVSLGEEEFRIDTGFIVYNEKNYPNFTQLLNRLGVATQPSNMSFSVRCDETGLEYNGTSLNTLFAQRRNLLSPAFHRMIRDILRFYRESRELLESPDDFRTLEEYLDEGGYSREFIDWHIFPMGSAIWSTGSTGIRRFPARFLVEFFDNHGFLNVSNRPAWRVVRGGSCSYIDPLARPYQERIRLNSPVDSVRRTRDAVVLKSRGESESFDSVVIATHSDQALGLLEDPSDSEKEVLGAISYQSNETVLHHDESLLPRRKRARASWNYHLPMHQDSLPSVTYWMNALQSLQCPQNFCVSLNRSEKIDPSRVIRRLKYAHPVYTADTLKAQARKPEISGTNRTFYSGAYWGYGFHEDGVNSALEVCRHFGEELS